MIYQLNFEDGKIEYCQAKSQLHLLQSYEKEYHGFQEIEEVIEISDEQAQVIMLKNSEYDEDHPDDEPEYYSLSDAIVGDDFIIVGSTEWC